MWIYLNNAFLSVVAHRDLPDSLLVRSRHDGDILRVFPSAEVSVTPEADYLYRATLPRTEVMAAIAKSIAGIEYDNFKNSVLDQERHAQYFDVYMATLPRDYAQNY